MEKVNVTIIGAGVVGLACALKISENLRDIVVVEKNSSFGQETSSRNSEVIHAGIYYPPGSLRARLCLEGKVALYDYCVKHNIGCKRIGKLIVAVDNTEIQELEKLFKNGMASGVSDLKMLNVSEITKIEPNIRATAAIFSPSTGILDTHMLMKNFETEAGASGAQIAYGTELINIEKSDGGYNIFVRDEREGEFSFFTRILINAAGLYSDKIAKISGIKNKGYALKYCKGDYFRVHNNKARYINHLIYPVPLKNHVSLGIHTALDLAGGLRLGPDAEYIDRLDYAVEENKKNAFYEDTKRFLPFIDIEDLGPDMAGIRPKLQGPGEEFRDFIIKEESGNNLEGLINLVGIDSPGLTCCLTIAEKVNKMVKEII
ncbi:MAG: NAD(P)/FAD-dependent oxidoreductase [Candidatus Omnitrophota bacterium]